MAETYTFLMILSRATDQNTTHMELAYKTKERAQEVRDELIALHKAHTGFLRNMVDDFEREYCLQPTAIMQMHLAEVDKAEFWAAETNKMKQHWKDQYAEDKPKIGFGTR